MPGEDVETLKPRAGHLAAATASVPALTILHHADPSRVGERCLCYDLAARGGELDVSRLAPGFGDGRTPLDDPFLSRTPLRIGRDQIGLSLVEGGASTLVDGAPLGGELTLAVDRLDRGVVLELADRVTLLLHRVQPSLQGPVGEPLLLGDSDAVRRLRGELARVAVHDIPVLLLGESGAGKELAARTVHDASARASEPFVAVNVGALPASTAAAALFGHARGAFTGAVKASRGFFGAAHRGTLFLDEIGEASPEVQVALLRALESGEVQPVGAETPRRVDVRVVAATDADLRQAVADGRFRLPLLQRLGAYEVRVPTLRDRPGDVARLLVHFLREELGRVGRPELLRPGAPAETGWLPSWLVAAACRARWPGNVRELRNVARRLVIAHADEPTIPREPRVRELLGAEPPPTAEPQAPAPRPAARDLGSYSDDEVREALRRNGWRPRPTARELGCSRTTLYRLMERIPGLRKAADLSADEIDRALAEHGGDVADAAAALEVSTRGLQLRRRELEQAGGG